MMHLWKVNILIEKLRTNGVDEHEKGSYLFTSMFALIFIVLFTGVAFDELDDTIQYTILIMQGIIVVIGSLLCIRANNSGDGKNIIERVVCLLVPTLFRQLAYSFGMLALIMVILTYYNIELSLTDGLLIIGGLIEFLGKPLFFIVMRSRLKRVAAL
jgi:hypothetical protein